MVTFRSVIFRSRAVSCFALWSCWREMLIQRKIACVGATVHNQFSDARRGMIVFANLLRLL